MPPRLIYLDQNKWIELARAVKGKSDSRLLQVLEILRESKRLGHNLFPLSLAHFMETNKRRELQSRTRLGELIWELSDNWTLAGPSAILQWELDRALAKSLNRRLEIRPFSLLGKGLRHASDHFKEGIKLDPSLPVPDKVRTSYEELGNVLLDRSMLTGVTPWGDPPERPDLDKHGKKFNQDIADDRARLSAADRDLQRRATLAIELVSILKELNAALEFHGITRAESSQLASQEGLTAFIDAMPSVRIHAHLRLQWIRNEQLPTRPSDLNDWGYVAPAAAYCDVVVTEKQLANLLNRGLQKKATVITELTDLAKV